MRLALVSVGFMILAASCSHDSKKEETANQSSALKSVVEAEHRSEENKARDQYRNPEATLAFFGTEPDMDILEISPGSGWYTEILAPYVKDEGSLTLAVFDDNTSVEYRKNMNKTLKDKVKAKPEVYGDINYVTFDVPEKMGPLGEPESYDQVLTFRNIHNWMRSAKLDAAFKAFHGVLKPGGTLGIVEHESKASGAQDPKGESGYVKKDYVIAAAEKAGFELVDQSAINENPKDSTVHPKGVWTLPPSYRLGDKDKKTYQDIGESHRMTLKFKKK